MKYYLQRCIFIRPVLLLQGYVKRQAVFACNTCTPNAAEPAGVCLACANKCHDGHDIFELYTKRYFGSAFFFLFEWHKLQHLPYPFHNQPIHFWCRNFRCDCGNSKFGEFKCQLIPVSPLGNRWFLTELCFTFVLLKILHFVCSQAKDEENVRNHYNHNFNGCYCTCDRPYPDTDDQVFLLFGFMSPEFSCNLDKMYRLHPLPLWRHPRPSPHLIHQ